MNHHPIADINTNVRCTGGIIGALEEDEVSRFCRASGDNITYTHQTVCGQSANAPTVAAVIDDPRNKTGAIEGSGGAASTPYIRVSEILLRFPDHVGKSGIRQSFARNVIVGVFSGDSIDVVPEDVRAVPACLEEYTVSLHFILCQTGASDHTVQALVYQLHIQDPVVCVSPVPGRFFVLFSRQSYPARLL